jgi:putative nucleotidyltransferase with HDIG domain
VGSATADIGEVVLAIESDPALLLAVLRAASAGGAQLSSVSDAVVTLGPEDLTAALRSVPATSDPHAPTSIEIDAEAMRLHALTTQRIADRVRVETGEGDREEIALVALLHDIGKLPMLAAFPRYREIARMPGSPEQLQALERRQYGVDHAAVGAQLARRLGLPRRLTTAIERHHAEDAHGEAAVVRLADLLAHRLAGDAVGLGNLQVAAWRLGLSDESYESILYELPMANVTRTPRAGRSPLSRRQVQVLGGLSDGKLYDEIATDLGVRESTVRTHLHMLYKKLGVADRAQAVLLATRKGWLY